MERLSEPVSESFHSRTFNHMTSQRTLHGLGKTTVLLHWITMGRFVFDDLVLVNAVLLCVRRCTSVHCWEHVRDVRSKRAGIAAALGSAAGVTLILAGLGTSNCVWLGRTQKKRGRRV